MFVKTQGDISNGNTVKEQIPSFPHSQTKHKVRIRAALDVRGSDSCPSIAAAGTTQSEPGNPVSGKQSSASSPAQRDECLAVLQQPGLAPTLPSS